MSMLDICVQTFRPWRAARRSGLFLAAIAVGLANFAGCGRKDNTAVAAASDARRPVPVTAVPAERQAVPVVIENFGTVEPYSTVAIRSLIAGQIVRVNFEEGQDVRANQLLFSIDPRPYDVALKQARANHAKDQAQYRFAQEELARYKNLATKGSVAQQKYDQTVSNAQVLEASIEADKAAIETAKIQLDYCSIHSPINGRTGDLLIHLGSIIKANDVPLVQINQIEPINIAFTAPQQELPAIRRYMAQAKLKVLAFSQKDTAHPIEGVLSFVNNTVDTATGTIALKATFPNRDRRLWPGEFVQVKLLLTVEPDAVVVPSQAVMTGQRGTYIFVVNPDNGSVADRPVTVGRSLDGHMVISQGIRPGEMVVTDGQLRLIPGATAEIKKPTATKEAPRR